MDSSPDTASSNNGTDSSSSESSPSSSDGPPPPSPSSDSSSSPPKNDSTPSSPPPKDESPPSSPPPQSPPPSPDAPPPENDSPPPASPPPNDDQFFPSPPNDGNNQSPPSQSPPSSNTTPSPPAPKNPGSPPSPVFSPPLPASSQSPPAPHAAHLSPLPHSGPDRPSDKPPGSSGNNSSPPSSDSDSSSNNVAVIAGLAVGGLLVIVVIVLCVWCNKRKKKQRYYMGPPKGGDQYENYNGQWNRRQSMGDHVMKIPQGEMGISQGGWAAATPHQATNSSSEFGSGFSGQGPLPPQSANMGGLGGFSQSQFSYEELAKATDGFSQANLLGQGGFGYVHKGILTDGREVAIKSLKAGSGQGEREFQAEVEIISRVHHRHLVSLVGYCIANGQRMLVYEFVANKTLEFHLHGKGQPVMDWETRLKIALGSAKGLAYLHEDCQHRIIHRDIKAANILLDYNYEALVADFGLAKLTSDNNTHVSTRVMGTFGYLAPEYASSGKLTEKSDVFSYGVMLLELITGRRPVDPNDKYMEDSLVDWARPLLTRALEEGVYDGLVDVRLEGNYDTDKLHHMVACAAASIRHSAKRRPKMSQIVRTLEGNASLEDLNDSARPGKTPGFAPSSGMTRTYDTAMYNADMTKFRKMVMTTQEFNSGEHGTTPT